MDSRPWNPVGLLIVLLVHVALVWLLAHSAIRSTALLPLRPLIQWLTLPEPGDSALHPSKAPRILPEQAQTQSGAAQGPRRERRNAKAPLPITLPSPSQATEPAATATPASTPAAVPGVVTTLPEPTPPVPGSAAAPPGTTDLLKGAATRHAIEETARSLERDVLHPRGPGAEPAPPRTVEQKINGALYRTPAYTEIRTADGELFVKMPDGSCMVNPSAAEIRDQGARIVRRATPESDARCPR